jgi:uncharacterized protein (TIGR04255 family)
MVRELPEPDQSHLPGSPLEVVVCQIQYDMRLIASEATTALAVHEALGQEASELGYESVQPAQAATLSVIAGPGTASGVTESNSLSGWRFATADGDWTVELMPDKASLETTAYGTWRDSFEPRLHRLFDALAAHVEPAIERRIGLRYVDRITELELPTILDWQPYLREELLGLALHPELGPGVRAAQHQTLLQLDEEIQCGIRHGPLVDQDRSVVDYVLDYDVFRQTGRRFDPTDVKSVAARLNRWAHQLFQATVTQELLQRFREPR